MRIMLNSSEGPVVAQGPAAPVLAADDVWFSYGPDAVLSGVSLTVRAGERGELTGPHRQAHT